MVAEESGLESSGLVEPGEVVEGVECGPLAEVSSGRLIGIL